MAPTSFFFTTASTCSAVAWPKACLPTQTAGASPQRPMQGAGNHAHVLAEDLRKPVEELLRAGHLAGKRVANAHRERGGRRVAFLHDVEVVVEGRNLVHLGHRELHRLGERVEVRGREAAEPVLHAMQVLDEVFGAARRAFEEAPDLLAGDRVHGAALRDRARAADLRDGNAEFAHILSLSLAGYSGA
jgi:hypothetical protein